MFWKWRSVRHIAPAMIRDVEKEPDSINDIDFLSMISGREKANKLIRHYIADLRHRKRVARPQGDILELALLLGFFDLLEDLGQTY